MHIGRHLSDDIHNNPKKIDSSPQKHHYHYMSVIDSDIRTRLLARKSAIEASLDIAYATLDKLLAKTAKEYRFDSGEGSQRVENMDIGKFQKDIYHLEIQYKRICQRLGGKLNVYANVRRKQ